MWKGPRLESTYNLTSQVDYVWLDKCIYEIKSSKLELYLNKFWKDIIQESGIYTVTDFNST
jgi:hypothetical protein